MTTSSLLCPSLSWRSVTCISDTRALRFGLLLFFFSRSFPCVHEWLRESADRHFVVVHWRRGRERERGQSGGAGCSSFCGQFHPTILICCNQWYYVAGCDTYLLPANLLRAIEGLDFQQRIVVGGHAGMHFDTLFLSGGSGLVFSQVMQVSARARAVCLLTIIPPSLPPSPAPQPVTYTFT